MKNRAFFLILLFLSLSLHSQHTWQWGKRGGSTTTYGNGQPFKEPVVDMATDPHGNVYMVAKVGGDNLNVDGTTLNFHFPADQFGYPDKNTWGGLLMSYDCDGNFRWSKLVSGSDYCGLNGVETDTLGNVYVTATCTPATKDFYGTEYRAHFDTDTIIPYSPDPNTYKQTLFMVQYDTLGNMKRFHSPQPPNIYLTGTGQTTAFVDFVVDPDGTQHYFVYAQNYENSGNTYYPVLEGDTLPVGQYMLRYDTNGGYLGNVKLDMAMTSKANLQLKISHDPVRKAYYMTGWNGTVYGSNRRDSLWVGGQLLYSTMFAAKFDSIGNNVWLKQGENRYGFLHTVDIDDQGNIYLSGGMSAIDNPAGTATFNGYTGQNNIFALRSFPVLIKMNANGDLIWGTNADTRYDDSGENIVIEGDKVSFTGRHSGITWGNFSFPLVYNSGYDAYHARFDKQTGAIISMDSLDSNWGYSEYPTAMAADKRGNVYIGGEFQGRMYVGNDTLTNIHYGIGSDYFLVKSGQANCNCPLPEATYSHNGSNGTVQFNYTGSANYDRLEWEFGDGTLQTTTTGTVNHSFADNIEYWVCVTAYDDSCGHDTWCSWVEPYKLSTETLPADSFSYYPNPMDDILNIVTKEAMAYTLFDLSGKTMGSGNLNQGGISLDTSALPSGFYMLRITDTNGARRVVKVVKR